MKARRYFSEGVNSIDETGESRFVAHGQHFADHGSFGEHQARFDDIPLANVNGDGFSCEWCFVERPLTFDDSAVGGRERGERRGVRLQPLPAREAVTAAHAVAAEAELAGQHEAHRGLDLARGERRLLRVAADGGRLAREAWRRARFRWRFLDARPSTGKEREISSSARPRGR